MAIALAVGVAVLAFGGTFYALTRPCVMGGCAELQTVERLHQTVSDQLSQGATLQDVSQSYTQLTDASYRLSQVPRWSRHSAAANRVQQQTESIIAALEPILAAQSAATEAVEITQNPPHALAVWQQAQALWERAIAQLQQVPESSPAYDLAQQKRLEYAENLAAIEQRIVLEQKAQDWVSRARQAVELAEARQGAATSMAARLEAHGTWRTAIALLQQVPDTAMAAPARQQQPSPARGNGGGCSSAGAAAGRSGGSGRAAQAMVAGGATLAGGAGGRPASCGGNDRASSGAAACCLLPHVSGGGAGKAEGRGSCPGRRARPSAKL
jgi:hypothetical protein